MKLIYSINVGKNENYFGEFCGYRNKTELLDSLLLTTHVSGKHFDSVELYCCSYAERLIKEDGRDFSHIKIINCLDALNDNHQDNWALSKLYVYALQKEPFLHLDIDAFLFSTIPDNVLNKGFLFQQVEPHAVHKFYVQAYDDAKRVGILPEEIKYRPVYSINTGLFAVSDVKYLPFVKEYYETAKAYVAKNVDYLDKKIIGWQQCVLFEQMFLVNLLEKYGLRLEIDFDVLLTEDYKNKYNIMFTHLISHSKRDQRNVDRIKTQLEIRILNKQQTYTN